MAEDADLALAFAQLAERLQGTDFEMTLQEALRSAIDCASASMGGVMLVRKGQVESAAVTDELVARADQLQREYGEGPCLEAIDERDTFVITDTRTDERWPNWCRAVDELGIRSVLSIRLQTPTGTMGALNLYGVEPNSFTDDDAVVGTILGTHAAAALAADKERDELRRAIDGRHMIGMAHGILMERFKLDADQSFSVLRRYSQDRNVKLREVANQLVESRTLPT